MEGGGGEMFDKPILITGAARSGTSITGGIVHKCGAWGGRMQADVFNHNKRAMYENGELRDVLLKPLLSSIGADPKGQNPLPSMATVKKANSDIWREKILRIISKQGYKDNCIWFYKDAKMCLMYSLWHSAFPNAKWILVRRRDEDIVNSCLRTGFMRAYGESKGWHRWVLEHEKLFVQMKEDGLDIMEVYPQRMIDGNFTEIKSVIKWLGLTWKEKEVRVSIHPELWSGRKN